MTHREVREVLQMTQTALKHRFRRASSMLLIIVLFGGCGDNNQSATVGAPSPSTGDLTPTSNIGAPTTPWSCAYTNRFSSALECKDFTGSGWTLDSARSDCDAQQGSTFTEAGCAVPASLGQCVLEGGTELATNLHFPGDDEAQCAITQQGCEVFAGGSFTPSALCEATSEMLSDQPAPMTNGDNVFYPPELLCAPSLDGTPGTSENDEVCTWQSIGGCTEPGRVFTDYASCEPVLTQRPFFPVPASTFKTEVGDPLYEDAAYQAEVEWVKGEAEACGCVCCHTSELSPRGAAAFDTAAEGIWTDSFTERGLAIAAGWIDSSPLGAHGSVENNGFDRTITGLPTTDAARMIRFFEGELARRGVERSRFEGATPVGGPLYTQQTFTPQDCANGEGVDENNRTQWTGGDARYVYVLNAGSENPGVPPNLDKPVGTIWKLDVDSRTLPVPAGITYGSTPDNTFQTIPAQGEAPELVQGESYYLYVLADVGAPITRCLFVYEADNEVENTGEPDPDTIEEPPNTNLGGWNEPCAEDTDCGAAADYCVKMPGDAAGYCSKHCDSSSACAQAGAPASWTCNAVSCSIPDFTWCGPSEEIADSGNFLSQCD
jgi:hypothetical protein